MSELLEAIDDKFYFSTYRKLQKEAIYKIVDARINKNQEAFLLESPTGKGKSVMAVTAARVFMERDTNRSDNTYGPKVLVLTKARDLQKQYSDSFSQANSLWSSRHYTCGNGSKEDGWYCNSPLCKKFVAETEKETGDIPHICYGCSYKEEQKKFFGSEVGVLNYSFFLAAKDLRPNYLIIDECHNMEDMICDHYSLKINFDEFKSLLDDLSIDTFISFEDKLQVKKVISALKKESDIRNCIMLIKEIIKHIEQPLRRTFAFLERVSLKDATSRHGRKKYKRTFFYNQILSELEEKSVVLSSKLNEICMKKSKDDICIKPLYMEKYVKSVLGRADFTIMMSATICGFEQFSKSLGITDYGSVSLPSDFPVENRKIIGLDLPSMNVKTRDDVLPVYCDVIDAILYNYKYRGIIHTVSYANAEFIKKNSKHKRRIIIPRGNDLLNIKNILTKKKSVIVASPSIMEGVDLSGNVSRLQIFLKVPFSFLGDEWIKSKKDMDNVWYLRRAVIDLVQGAGRSVRSEQDYALTYILDSNFRRLVTTSPSKELFPNWFKESVTLS